MQVGESFILEFTITNTNPVTNLEFDIGEMLGHADALTFGKPAVSFGEAYRHDDPVDTPEFEGKLIHLDPLPSNTGTHMLSQAAQLSKTFRPVDPEEKVEGAGPSQHRSYQRCSKL